MPDRSPQRRTGYAAGACCALVLLLAACGPRPIGEGTLGQASVSASAVLTAASATTPSSDVTVASTSASASARATSSASSSEAASASAAAPARPGATATSGTATPAAAAPTSGTNAAVTLYFTKGGKLVPEARTVAAADPLRSSLEELMAGPTVAGDYSEVPKGTRLLGVSVTGSTANVNLSGQVQSLQGAPAIPLFLGQVVNTATQFQGVERVSLQVEGRPVRTLGGEGVAVPEPLDKAAVQRLLAESGA